MQKDVGPFRTRAGLSRALEAIAGLRSELEAGRPAAGKPFDAALTDWLDLEAMTSVARCVAQAALGREESRGAHQREDYPATSSDAAFNQVVSVHGSDLRVERRAVKA